MGQHSLSIDAKIGSASILFYAAVQSSIDFDFGVSVIFKLDNAKLRLNVAYEKTRPTNAY